MSSRNRVIVHHIRERRTRPDDRRLHTATARAHHPTAWLLAAAIAVLIIALAATPPPADAHEPRAQTCGQYAAATAIIRNPARPGPNTAARARRACHRALAAHRRKAHCIDRVIPTIHCVFGAYGWQAVAVARCESGFDVTAANGQYLGLFQMGEGERARWGHGSDALSQTRAAFRYFVASGRDWSPWECKP